ncbi:hypothetical protein MRX96_040357 [Rhipicephalus microplus]
MEDDAQPQLLSNPPSVYREPISSNRNARRHKEVQAVGAVEALRFVGQGTLAANNHQRAPFEETVFAADTGIRLAADHTTHGADQSASASVVPASYPNVKHEEGATMTMLAVKFGLILILTLIVRVVSALQRRVYTPGPDCAGLPCSRRNDPWCGRRCYCFRIGIGIHECRARRMYTHG